MISSIQKKSSRFLLKKTKISFNLANKLAILPYLEIQDLPTRERLQLLNQRRNIGV